MDVYSWENHETILYIWDVQTFAMFFITPKGNHPNFFSTVGVQQKCEGSILDDNCKQELGWLNSNHSVEEFPLWPHRGVAFYYSTKRMGSPHRRKPMALRFTSVIKHGWKNRCIDDLPSYKHLQFRGFRRFNNFDDTGVRHIFKLPSGKQPHNYGKSPFLMGKPTTNGQFQ